MAARNRPKCAMMVWLTVGWLAWASSVSMTTMQPGPAGMGDAEEAEDGRTDELDDGEEDDGVDGDFAGKGAVGVDGGVPDQAEEDERRAEGVDERKKRAKAQ